MQQLIGHESVEHLRYHEHEAQTADRTDSAHRHHELGATNHLNEHDQDSATTTQKTPNGTSEAAHGAFVLPHYQGCTSNSTRCFLMKPLVKKIPGDGTIFIGREQVVYTAQSHGESETRVLCAFHAWKAFFMKM